MFSSYSHNFWINLIGFNLAWYLSVFFGNEGALLVLLLLLMHFVFHRQPLIELYVVLCLGLFGYSVDFLLTLMGFFKFHESQAAPVWLLLLWFAFSATLRQSLSFFAGRPLMGAFFGAIGGSSSYVGAVLVGPVSFGYSLAFSAVVIAFIWAILFPCLIRLSNQIEVYLCTSR